MRTDWTSFNTAAFACEPASFAAASALWKGSVRPCVGANPGKTGTDGIELMRRVAWRAARVFLSRRGANWASASATLEMGAGDARALGKDVASAREVART